MPQFVPKPMGRLGFVGVVTALLMVFHALASSTSEDVAVVLGALLMLFTVGQIALKKQRQALARLAVSREGQSICDFARDFDTRQVDTWVIRAVYEIVQARLSHLQPGFPVRAADRLWEDLKFAPDDLDLEVVAEQVAQRTGRSHENSQNNPYHGKVKTVGDVVLFFQAQPVDTSRRFPPGLASKAAPSA